MQVTNFCTIIGVTDAPPTRERVCLVPVCLVFDPVVLDRKLGTLRNRKQGLYALGFLERSVKQPAAAGSCGSHAKYFY